MYHIGDQGDEKTEIIKIDHGTLTLKDTNFLKTLRRKKPETNIRTVKVTDFDKAVFESAVDHF
jgi:dTDP-4-dehydrorhamnose reductase